MRRRHLLPFLVLAGSSARAEPSWPEGADGDVFRQLQKSGFDFSSPHAVEYDVDFESWPPDPKAIQALIDTYTAVKLSPPEEVGDIGYVRVTVDEVVEYNRVIAHQKKISAEMRPYGGVCHSWGVLVSSRIKTKATP